LILIRRLAGAGLPVPVFGAGLREVKAPAGFGKPRLPAVVVRAPSRRSHTPPRSEDALAKV